MYANTALQYLKDRFFVITSGETVDSAVEQIDKCLAQLSNSNGILHGILAIADLTESARETIKEQITKNESALGIPQKFRHVKLTPVESVKE